MKKDLRRTPNHLRKYRRMNGFKQKEVAKILGLNASRLSRWEKGRTMPSSFNLFRLSILYKTMADSLFMDLIRKLREEIKEKEKEFLDKNKMY